MRTADIHPVIDSRETVEDCIRPSSFSCSFYQKGVSINELFEVSSLTFTNSTTDLHNQIRIISSQDDVALD
ncbi:MAG: hypothetical protein P8L44_01050 [Opitutales bacterium]|nr:hypothetical protein [Opitutales bacterium]